MTEIEAANIMNCLDPALNKLNEAIRYVELLSNTEERESLRRTLIGAMGTIIGDAVGPICYLYPELDPFREKAKD